MNQNERQPQRPARRPAPRPAPGRAPAYSSQPVQRTAQRQGQAGQRSARNHRGASQKGSGDASGFKFLGIMLIAALLLCGGIVAVFMERDKPEHDASQTSAEPATVSVTFPEGRTVRQYGALLETNGVCAAEDFYTEMRTTDFTEEYSFLPSNDILQQREYPLEGYLYPDTYTFYVGEKPQSVIKRFLNNFRVKISDEAVSYADSNGEGFKTAEISFDKAVILASIIERESPDNSERDKISAVFWNRMEHPSVSGTGGKLQSDATHYYPYVVSDERPAGFRSEYDTYTISGLPKGPICSPSASSIMAAVYPDKECKAYFFFNDNYGNHYYAETYKQHKKNIQYCKDNGLA